MDKQKIKLVAFGSGGLFLVLIMILFIGGKQINQERKEQIEISVNEINSLSSKVNEDMNDYMLANDFIMDHLPYEIESSKVYDHSHTAEQPKMNRAELQQTVIAQLNTSILNRDVNAFLATFKVDNYLTYINSFNSHEDMLEAVELAFDNILKNDSLHSIGYIEEKDNMYLIYFLYDNGHEIVIPVTMSLMTDSHSRSKYYLISTPLEDLLTYFN